MLILDMKDIMIENIMSDVKIRASDTLSNTPVSNFPSFADFGNTNWVYTGVQVGIILKSAD